MDINQFKQQVEKKKIPDKQYFYKRSEESKTALVEDLFASVEYLQKNHHLCTYLIYGTLLGAVREKDFILHDNDVDIAYVSHYHTKEEVLAEFHKICSALTKEGLISKICDSGQFHLYSPNKRHKIDVWTSFVENDKYYLVPVIDGEISVSNIFPLQSINFKGHLFLAPKNYNTFLTFMYNDWKTPLARKEGNKRDRKWKHII